MSKGLEPEGASEPAWRVVWVPFETGNNNFPLDTGATTFPTEVGIISNWAVWPELLPPELFVKVA